MPCIVQWSPSGSLLFVLNTYRELKGYHFASLERRPPMEDVSHFINICLTIFIQISNLHDFSLGTRYTKVYAKICCSPSTVHDTSAECAHDIRSPKSHLAISRSAIAHYEVQHLVVVVSLVFKNGESYDWIYPTWLLRKESLLVLSRNMYNLLILYSFLSYILWIIIMYPLNSTLSINFV